MKAFVHLSLLTLLFVTLANGTNTSTADPAAATATATNTSTADPAAATATATTTTPAADATTATTTTPTADTATTTTTTPAADTATATTTTPAADTATATTTTPAADTATATTTTPAANATTAAAAANGTNTTTAAPATNATVTTAAPAANGTNTTTAVPAANATTTTAGPIANATTSAPSSSSVTPLTTSNPNPNISGPCQKDSCKGGSSCIGLNSSHFCLCTDGYYYSSNKCNKGKVFPGTIKVNVSETFGLGNEMSKTYEELYQEVTKFFKDAFASLDYEQTVIHKVIIPAPARSEMHAGGKLVDVEVVNLFVETTKQNVTTVSNAIEDAISKKPNFESYTKQDQCEFYGCVKTSEQDDCSDGLLCKCKLGLERPNPQTPLCLALGSKCSDACSAEHNKQCVVKSNGSSDCLCLPGYQMDDQKHCRECAFGYSGVNCEDSFELILTIVGTIAGTLILGMLIALISLRSKKKKEIEEENLMENDFQSLRLSSTGFTNLGAEGSIFPKVRATIPKESPMQNPYARGSMPRPDY